MEIRPTSSETKPTRNTKGEKRFGLREQHLTDTARYIVSCSFINMVQMIRSNILHRSKQVCIRCKNFQIKLIDKCNQNQIEKYKVWLAMTTFDGHSKLYCMQNSNNISNNI